MIKNQNNDAEVEHVTQYMFDLVRSAYASPVDALHPTWHPAMGVQAHPAAAVLSGFDSKPQLSDTEINEFLCAADLDERVDAGLFLVPTEAPDTWPLDVPEPLRAGDDWFTENSEVL